MLKKSGLLVVLFLTLPLAFIMSRGSTKRKLKTNLGQKIDWSPISDSEFKNLLPYIQAQSAHETGNFSSPLAQRHNNLFGMQKVNVRKNFQKGTTIAEGGREFGVYGSKVDSVRDFVEYLRQWKTQPFPRSVTSARSYAKALQTRGYFTDDFNNYVNGLERWLT